MSNFHDARIARGLIEFDACPEGLPGKPEAVLAFCEQQLTLVDDDSCYWQLLAAAWIGSGSSLYAGRWIRLFQCTRTGRWKLMKKHDRQAWRALPAKVRAWRGCRPGEDASRCLAWSLKRETAEKFRLRYGGSLAEAVFDRRLVAAFWSRRGEDEILVLNPAHAVPL